ncbi:type II secretion system minor pseudopilin GspJ [Thalassotalea sp. PLHSN55]|uniref:type II secretion system minor pseudopilin GspJ n=1 Tax=Thalassotalea sp. PLHSN55 TaxID=3435888 RepID=UPI003F82F6AE
MAFKSYQSRQQGFTFIEVLLAIAIFSVVSLAGITILDSVIKGDEKSKMKTERLNELQRAFLIIERDFIQIARRRIRLNGEEALDGFIHTDDDSFSTSTQAIGFVRSGWSNPGLMLPRSDMQSVGYQINDNVLERVHFNFVDAVVGEEPKVRPLITLVDNISFEFHDGEDWRDKLAGNTLPFAIAMEIETQDFGIIRRQFLVAGDPAKGSN